MSTAQFMLTVLGVLLTVVVGICAYLAGQMHGFQEGLDWAERLQRRLNIESEPELAEATPWTVNGAREGRLV
jgi:hypothetical protein